MRISDWSSDVCSSDLPPMHVLHGTAEYVSDVAQRSALAIQFDHFDCIAELLATHAAFSKAGAAGRRAPRAQISSQRVSSHRPRILAQPAGSSSLMALQAAVRVLRAVFARSVKDRGYWWRRALSSPA